MEHATIIGIDLAKRSFQSARRLRGRVGCVSQEAEPGKGAELHGVAAAMRRSDGGLCELAPLGPRDRDSSVMR